MKYKKMLDVCIIAVTSALAACGAVKGENFSITANGDIQKTSEPEAVSFDTNNKMLFKAENNENNPLITNIFAADPTAVEYNGRLYVYGTSDDQQYREKPNHDNTYEAIKSFVIISTEDMVNWRYEGEINTKEIAPWIIASWAPSVVSREESDGKTHFYLYFSNSGAGVGVLTATDPAGPWSDPLGKPLISAGMSGLENCPNPFDPGACIDDNGVSWLSFGGGVASGGSPFMPGVARIVKLGADMLSFDSDFVEVKTPYFFEASELNFINGTYVYTYNTSWEKRTEWDDSLGELAPPSCSMAYLTSKTPLDTDSWQYQDYYLKNPGELEMEYSNNHTHLQEFKGKYYLFYHTLVLQKERGINRGFRALSVDEVTVDEENAIINVCDASRVGAAQIGSLDAYAVHQAQEVYLTDCEFADEDNNIFVKCKNENVIGVKGVDFKDKCKGFAAKVRGSGTLEVRLDKPDGDVLSALTFDTKDWAVFYNDAETDGKHDLFFVFDGEFDLDEWQFAGK